MNSALTNAVVAVEPTLSPIQRQMLGALLCSPNHAASASQLRTLFGLKAVIQVNFAIGRIGHKVLDCLGRHPDDLSPGTYEYWSVIATGGAHTADSSFLWSLRPEVVDGLHACGYSTAGIACPNEISAGQAVFEGAVTTVSVNSYERNPVARELCIAAHGHSCCVCSFDFGATYGEAALGIIHVHHLKALSSIGQEYEIDPVADLRPVCPNCHAVIHRRNPSFSIDEMQAMLLASATLRVIQHET